MLSTGALKVSGLQGLKRGATAFVNVVDVTWEKHTFVCYSGKTLKELINH